MAEVVPQSISEVLLNESFYKAPVLFSIAELCENPESTLVPSHVGEGVVADGVWDPSPSITSSSSSEQSNETGVSLFHIEVSVLLVMDLLGSCGLVSGLVSMLLLEELSFTSFSSTAVFSQ